MPSRRSHVKSRLGCKQCKTRHIKCEGTPPSCTSCTKKNIECEFLVYKNSIDDNTPPGMDCGSDIQQVFPDARSESIGLEDRSYFNHFVASTSHTLNPLNDERYRQLWQDDVPHLALSHEFLLHAVLGFSAAHKATLYELDQEHQIRDIAATRKYYNKALGYFRDSVEEMREDHADAVLCFCTLICFLTLRLEISNPLPCEDAIDVFEKLSALVHHSVRLLSTVQQRLQTSQLGRLLLHNAEKPHHYISRGVMAALERLEDLAGRDSGTLPTPEAGGSLIKAKAIEELYQFYTAIDPRPDTWQFVLCWPMSLEPGFASLVRRRDPLALCIVAHWVVAAFNAPKSWWFGDWPRDLMIEISRTLHQTEWAETMVWPISQTLGTSPYT